MYCQVRFRFDTGRFICATPDKTRHSFFQFLTIFKMRLIPFRSHATSYCTWHPLSCIEHALGTSLLVVVSTTDSSWVRGGREGVGRRARHARTFGREMENGRARRDGHHVSSGAATPPPPYSHLILIRLCRMYYSVSITVEFLLFEALPSRQTSTSNLLPRLTSFTLNGN